MDKKILTEIDNAIRYIWEYEIKQDYDKGYLLKEDTLKNSLYFHLRTKLSALLEEHNIRIFTEFNAEEFKTSDSRYRPDMIFAEIDSDTKEVLNYICVIEIKYKYGFSTAECISKDYDKIKYYIDNIENDCYYYMATIWEYEDRATTWIRKNAAWAKNRLTELNASFENEKMRFYIHKHE